MEDVQAEGQKLLSEFKRLNFQLAQEKARIQAAFEKRIERIQLDRNQQQAMIRSLRPLVEKGLAPEDQEVEYLLALDQRMRLDVEYHDVQQAIAQLNLPVEEVRMTEDVELDGETFRVES